LNTLWQSQIRSGAPFNRAVETYRAEYLKARGEPCAAWKAAKDILPYWAKIRRDRIGREIDVLNRVKG